MEELDIRIFNRYIQHKCECLTANIEQGMQAGGFDWDCGKPPERVRTYVKELFLQLVIVHAEVVSA